MTDYQFDLVIGAMRSGKEAAADYFRSRTKRSVLETCDVTDDAMDKELGKLRRKKDWHKHADKLHRAVWGGINAVSAHLSLDPIRHLWNPLLVFDESGVFAWSGDHHPKGAVLRIAYLEVQWETLEQRILDHPSSVRQSDLLIKAGRASFEHVERMVGTYWANSKIAFFRIDAEKPGDVVARDLEEKLGGRDNALSCGYQPPRS